VRESVQNPRDPNPGGGFAGGLYRLNPSPQFGWAWNAEKRRVIHSSWPKWWPGVKMGEGAWPWVRFAKLPFRP